MAAGSSRTLKSRVAKGVGLSGMSAVVTAAVQLAQMMVLARLLGPEAFGLMAIVVVVVSLADLVGQMGLHEAIVARRDVTDSVFSSLYWFGVGCGIVTYLVFLTTTPLVVWIFGEDELGLLIPVTLISIVIAPLGTPFLALAQKAMRFGILTWVEIVSAVAGLATAVVSAWYWDQGVWALVWAHLTRVVIRTIAFALRGWLLGPRPAFQVDLADLRGFLRFGLFRIAAMSVNLLNSRIDQILIGSLLGVQALGFYSMAANLTLTPMQMINPVITRVAFPAFAKLQDDIPQLRSGYLHLLRALTFVNAPMLIGFAAVAGIAVPLLLGEAWQDTIILVQILAVYTLLRSVGNASGSLLLGLGRADITFYWNFGLLVVVPPVVYLASLTESLEYIAWSMAGLQVALFFALYFLVVRRLLGPCFGPFVGAFLGPAALSAAMAVVVLGVAPFIASATATMVLTTQILVGVASYGLLVMTFQRSYLRQLLAIAKDRAGGHGDGEIDRVSS